jgi:hypothetical protein
VLLQSISVLFQVSVLLGALTATSRTSLLPPLSVVKALRMEGSCSVSNLTWDEVSACYVDAMPFIGSAIAKFSGKLTSTTAP